MFANGRRGALRNALAITALVVSTQGHAETVVRIGGSGMGLMAMQRAAESVPALEPGVRFEVLPSLGTPGGIRALIEGEINLAIGARALKPEELAAGVREAVCMSTAMVFASSHQAPAGVSRAQLPSLFADANPSWPDGTPLRVILRSRAGSENPYLVSAVPGMGLALDAAYKRSGVPVGMSDQENADLALRTPGSFAVMTLLQVRAERLDLRVVSLDGIVPSAESIAGKQYPLTWRICILQTASPAPMATRFVEHLRSPAGQMLLRSFGAEPAT